MASLLIAANPKYNMRHVKALIRKAITALEVKLLQQRLMEANRHDLMTFD